MEVFYLKVAVLCKRVSVTSNWQVYIVDTDDIGQHLTEVEVILHTVEESGSDSRVESFIRVETFMI